MKYLMLTLLFITGCVSKTLIGYEPDKVVSKKIIQASQSEPTTLFSFESTDNAIMLRLEKSLVKTETWEKQYSRNAVYEKRCKGWYRYNDTNTDCFIPNIGMAILQRILIIGLFYDVTIPSQEYGPPIRVSEEAGGTIIKTEDETSELRNPSKAKQVTLVINGKKISKDVQNGELSIGPDDLALKQSPLIKPVSMLIRDDKGEVDLSDKFNSKLQEFVLHRTETRLREGLKPENRFKLPYCTNPDLFLTAIVPAGYEKQVEENCMYVVDPRKIVVKQSLDGGVLISASPMMGMSDFRNAFIRGSLNYIDGDRVKAMIVKAEGIFRYTNVLGAPTTVRRFKYLGDL